MTHAPAGDVDYGKIGQGYAQHRKPDPRIERLIHEALGDARTVLNVGAGAGSYEPTDRHVIAFEPAIEMRRQRPLHRVPGIDGRAEALPLDDASVDASMATITVHQWRERAKGLQELMRVTRGPIVILTFDPDLLPRFWLNEYVPELIIAEAGRYGPIADLAQALSAGGRRAEVRPVPIPIDCTDGFTEAFYARPERLLDPNVRRAQSAWNFVDSATQDRFHRSLEADLASGGWDIKHGRLRTQPTFDGSLRLVVSNPSA